MPTKKDGINNSQDIELWGPGLGMTTDSGIKLKLAWTQKNVGPGMDQ